MRFSVATLLPATLAAAAILAPSAVAEPPTAVPSAPSVLPQPQAVQAAPAPLLSSPTVLVKTASEAVAERVAARHGLTLARGFPWIDWYELATPPGTADAGAAKTALDADPDVQDTDAMARDERAELAYQPQDDAWNPAWTLSGGERATWNLTTANFPAAWEKANGQGTQIGIIDSEFDTTHPDLQGKVRNPWNVASGTLNYLTPNVRANDGESSAGFHGSHVAGIAAAFTDNGLGISGSGFDATFVPVRISTSFDPSGGNPVDAKFVGDLTQALGYMATQNVVVVNMSLGALRAHPPLAAAIQAVRARGISIVASAGNFQQIQSGATVYPAAYDGVIAVGNTRSDDTIAPSSSNGSWVDVSAPGTHILSTWDMRLGGYAEASGTSMSAPLVSGLIALMKSARPDLTPDEVEALLKASAVDLGSQGADPQFGAGRIDAAAAVTAAIAYQRPAPPAPPASPAPAPVVAQAPPADTVAPKVTVAGLVTVAGRSVAVRVTCSEGCNGTVRLRSASRRLLASKLFGAGPGKTITVRLKTRKRLKPRAKVFIEVAAKDASGNLATKVQRRKLRK